MEYDRSLIYFKGRGFHDNRRFRVNTIMHKAYLHTYCQASIFQISNSNEKRAC
jgi:hypothetical protein